MLEGSRALLIVALLALGLGAVLLVVQLARPCESCQGMPGETAWIYVGNYNSVTGEFAQGPFVLAQDGRRADQIDEGDWITVSASRRTMILDFDVTGTLRAMDDPFCSVATLAAMDSCNNRGTGVITYTCRNFDPGQRLYVADRAMRGPSETDRNLWLRVRLEPPG